MSKHDAFLVEIGTEELPPKALRTLMDAFASALEAALDEAPLAHGAVHAYASPRRLAVLVDALATGQEDRKTTQKGPPVSVAFDKDGSITAAGQAFADKCGVAADELQRSKTDKGEWLSCTVVEKGKTAATLLPALVEKSLAALPIPRRMRWGAGDAEFVRPVHWIVLMHGNKASKASIMGIRAGNKSRGHRFHTAGTITITTPADYLQILRDDGYVVADFEERRALVRKGVEAAASKAGGTVVDGEALYDEVTALVEWPVAITGSFDAEYLRLPREAVISTLTGHQRYFPVADKSGALLPRFVTVANLESKDPQQVRDGNERVIRPRLADAAFFWDADRRRPLASRQEALRDVVYQRGLGSVHDKSQRTAALAQAIAAALEVDAQTVQRAALLAKCDLLTGMVGEFPELQGTMGRYYAAADGEPDAVADAIAEHYLPRFAGDALPASIGGQVLAVADRLDTLAGVFTIGKTPSGNRDPFGLRRAALGIVRIVIDCGLDFDLKAMLATAVAAQPKSAADTDGLVDALYTFISERLRSFLIDRDPSLATETFDAVVARAPASLVDFEQRINAVQSFIRLESAASLAAANKRIANILRKADAQSGAAIKEKLLVEPAEAALWEALENARATVAPLLESRDYAAALTALAGLREPVDRFFDAVLVMAEHKPTQQNRLALLGELRALFLNVADISRLSI